MFAIHVLDDQHPSSVANTNELLVGVVQKGSLIEHIDTKYQRVSQALENNYNDRK